MSNQDAMRQAAKFSTLSQTREEDSANETKADSDEVGMVSWPESTTSTIGKRPRTHQGSLVEGGSILLDQVAKTTWSNAGSVENSTTTKRRV